MKHFFTFIVLTLFVCSCSDSTSFLNLTIDLEDGSKAYIIRLDETNQPQTLDTLEINSGVLIFEMADAEIPEMHYISFEGIRDVLPVVIEKGDIQVEAYKDSIRASLVTGTPSNNLFRSYQQESQIYIKDLMKIQNEMRNAMIIKDSLLLTDLQDQFLELRDRLSDYEINFTKENSDSYISSLILEQLIKNNVVGREEAKIIFDSFSAKIKQTLSAKSIEAILNPMESDDTNSSSAPSPGVGDVAPNFNAPNTEGITVSLENLKGKLTLIDFWASWCGPCRRGNPTLVKIYNEYKDKGLKVVGVSLDRDKDRWQTAILQDNLNWGHVSNLQYWNDPIAKAYSVSFIPQYFLLDDSGKIVFRGYDTTQLKNNIALLL